MNKRQKEIGKLMYSLHEDIRKIYYELGAVKLKNEEAQKRRDIALRQIDNAHLNIIHARSIEVHDK